MIVLDSSFLIAYHNEHDVHHAAATEVMGPLLNGTWGELLLPEYIFLEVVTVLAARIDLHTAVDVGAALLDARELEFVPCSELFLETFDLFRGQSDMGLSFADAAIVAIARRRQADYVATFDADFKRVEGIVVVPSGEAKY